MHLCQTLRKPKNPRCPGCATQISPPNGRGVCMKGLGVREWRGYSPNLTALTGNDIFFRFKCYTCIYKDDDGTVTGDGCDGAMDEKFKGSETGCTACTVSILLLLLLLFLLLLLLLSHVMSCHVIGITRHPVPKQSIKPAAVTS